MAKHACERGTDARRRHPGAHAGAVDRRLPTRPREEIARLGREIYERDIRPQVEANYHGEIVSIDVNSASWAIGGTVIADGSPACEMLSTFGVNGLAEHCAASEPVPCGGIEGVAEAVMFPGSAGPPR